ncbi:MAG: GntR family transcriptional regulator [Burkholderiales bacterium]|nr:GntR family transcriptional regulator [Burkholderiales bacterium]
MAPRSRSKRPARSSSPDDSALQRIAARSVPAGGNARSLAEVACDEIRRAIREGRVATGAHLTEVDLAAWLGMSRTPIREAMRRLQSEGLLLNQPFRGALVMRLDADDMRQMFAVRELLEPAAAAACAVNAGPADIAALRAILDEEAVKLDNPAALIPLNRQFHDIILESARNQFLSKAIAGVYSLIPLLGDSNLLNGRHAREAHAQHQEIVDAIEHRDAARAEVLAREHVRASLRTRLARIADNVPQDFIKKTTKTRKK